MEHAWPAGGPSQCRAPLSSESSPSGPGDGAVPGACEDVHSGRGAGRPGACGQKVQHGRGSHGDHPGPLQAPHTPRTAASQYWFCATYWTCQLWPLCVFTVVKTRALADSRCPANDE